MCHNQSSLIYVSGRYGEDAPTPLPSGKKKVRIKKVYLNIHIKTIFSDWKNMLWGMKDFSITKQQLTQGDICLWPIFAFSSTDPMKLEDKPKWKNLDTKEKSVQS